MPTKLLLKLSLLWFLVVIHKFPFGEPFYGFINHYIDDGSYVPQTGLFFQVTLFPFICVMVFYHYFRKYRSSYYKRHINLYILIGGAAFFSFSSICWTIPKLRHTYPIELLAGFSFFEAYFSISLLLLFIALLFFAFGKDKPVQQPQ